MALLFADTGGANYDTSTLNQFWAGFNGSPLVQPGLDGSCISGPASTWAVAANSVVPLGTGSSVGFACSLNTTIFNPNSPILEISGSNGALNLFLYISADGTLKAIQPSGGGIIAASSPGAFSFNTRQYIEFVYLCNSGGTNVAVNLYLNGTLLGGNNISAACQASTFTSLGDIGDNFGGDLQIGTVYINDTTGSFCNTVLGNTYMNLLLPDSEGRVDTWTPFGNSPNFACVNTVPPPGDSTYNFSSTVNNADTYGMAAPPGNLSAITGVVSMASLKIDVAGSRSVAVGLGNGSTESYGSGVVMTTSYETVRQNFSSNPFTSAGWLTTDIAGLQGAVKVTA